MLPPLRTPTELIYAICSILNLEKCQVPLGACATLLDVKNDSSANIVATSLECVLKIAGLAQSLTYHVSA